MKTPPVEETHPNILALGDGFTAADLAEHAGHLGGELHLGTLAHLSRGAGVSHRGLVLAQDDLAALALRTYYYI